MPQIWKSSLRSENRSKLSIEIYRWFLSISGQLTEGKNFKEHVYLTCIIYIHIYIYNIGFVIPIDRLYNIMHTHTHIYIYVCVCVESIGFHWVSVWLYRQKLPENPTGFFSDEGQPREAARSWETEAAEGLSQGGWQGSLGSRCVGVCGAQATPKLSKLWMTWGFRHFEKLLVWPSLFS